MAKSKEVTRNFTMEDSLMLGTSAVVRTFFLEDKAKFVNFNSMFNDPYSLNWETAITAANNMLLDHAVLSQQVQTTDAVRVEMKNCCNYFQETKFAVKKAFPDNAAVWNEFGFNDFVAVRRSKSKLLDFMEQLFAVANKYKPKLIAVGFSQAKITEINTLRVQLDNANIAQDIFKHNRPVLTRERINQMNKVWNITSDVCLVGKRIFADDYAMYQRYLLPLRRKSAPPNLPKGKELLPHKPS